MNKNIVLSLIFIFTHILFGNVKGQEISREINNDIVYNENDYTGPIYPKGNDVFIDDFKAMIHAYIDLSMYYVNGKFNFRFHINEKGKIDNVEVHPQVRNGERFIEDMIFAAKRVKTKWIPAKKAGIPVKSIMYLNLDFTTDHFD